MEEDSGVKAPVTRLRRRLSVELSEESKSPGPATPTKKRGGRLAAKPQLELIDENTPQNSPKKITRRRSTARDIAEVEEKPLTPSRRSTRIKSNTSIISDTPQAVDSPRAMRALRRNSQLGSDTETPTPVTPARTRRGRVDSTTSLDKQATSASGTPVTPARIRRTRKDSASNVDKPVENEEASGTPLINKVITEEPENHLTKSVSNGESPNEKKIDSSPSSPRKSPRLMAKKNRKSKSENNQNQSPIHEPDVNMNISASKSKLDSSISESGDVQIALESKQEDVSDGTSPSGSANILNNIGEESNKKLNMNKSTSSLLQIPFDVKTKRQRTKSWTTLSSSSPKEGSFYSDNESTKKKIKNKANILTITATKDFEKSNQSLKVQGENDTEKYLYNSINKKKKSQNSESDKSMNESILNQSKKFYSPTGQSPKPSKDNPECNIENLSDKTSKNPAEYLFQKTPSSNIQSVLFIEDSDTDSLGKTNRNTKAESEDQRVPEVEQVKNNDLLKESESNILNIPTENQLFTSLPTTTNNDTCEPMDIDETMPENVSLKDHSGENKSVNESKNKSIDESSVIISHDKSANKIKNKSKRKSSLSNSVTQDHEATDNGNKSTLILSQIQDTSKTSNDSRQVNDMLSKSLKETETNKKIVNKNISMSCLTSTPVQQKDDKKLSMQMNTSAISPHNESKKVTVERKKNISIMSKSSQPDSSDESSDDDKEHNSLVIDEAEDAGDDYESGDSQDEEEKQYEKDHEIVDKGVTLTSDDEVSNDSDYEKDSFVVSSNEEDNELLSGSGEDLNMSDNELTMSAKSKKKYNERYSKQQKKASREMFQARHDLNKTEQSPKSKVAKSNRQRLDSSLLESGDDAVVPPKKKKRMRLESTMDSSAADAEGPKPTETLEVEEIGAKKKERLSESMSQPSNDEEVSMSKNKTSKRDKSVSEVIGYKKKKSKRLSQSICDESFINEKEITAICDTTTADDPLQLQVKQEPKTPQKDLDISTVHFSVREEIEQVQVNNDVSIVKGNETSDPLQSSMIQDENDEDSNDDNSSISENEEITKNYDSMLNQLNKDAKPKIKSADISLNLNNKKKQKPKQTVIDQLNITQTKKLKSKQADTTESILNFKKTTIPKNDDASSESVDLNLLFSDDSNESEKELSAVQTNTEIEENILSLKGSEDASQIQANNSISLNTSKKKNKRNSAQKDNSIIVDGQSLPIFIDTVGNREEALNNSEIKNKKNKINKISANSHCEDEIEDASQIQANDSISLNTNKKMNKRKSAQKDNSIIVDGQSLPIFIDTVGNREEALNNSEIKNNKNKINKISANSHCEDGIEGESKAEDNGSVELLDTSSKKKKKLKKLSQSIEKEEKETNIMLKDDINEGCEKKKKADQDGISENKKRKRLSSVKDVVDDLISKDSGNIPTGNIPNQMNESLISNSKKKRKLVPNEDFNVKSRKRKEREDDVQYKESKVFKQNSADNKPVPRLPTTILEQLEDKSKRLNETKVPKVVSTTEFKVEETRIRRNKPSNFLEESIYLNTDSESSNIKKQKLKVKKPVVLPFTPTASISDSGFTTKFHITPIPQKIEFVAQSTETTNYKTDYLNARRSKKISTYELYKTRRNVNLSKY